jgi:hypothetical protein
MPLLLSMFVFNDMSFWMDIIIVSMSILQLHDYQHNMGLLLMERNDWTTNYKLLEIAAIEKKDKLKQEQSEHLISLTEAEKREKSLKRDLEAQKHRVYEVRLFI